MLSVDKQRWKNTCNYDDIVFYTKESELDKP